MPKYLKNTCKDCHHVWRPRKRAISKKCPKCGSTNVTNDWLGLVAATVVTLVIFAGASLKLDLDPGCLTGMVCGLGGLGGMAFVVIGVLGVIKSTTQAQKQQQVAKQQQLQQQEILALTRNIYSLAPEEFEEYVGILFQKQGYQVQQVGKTGDMGIDLRLEKNGNSAIVQCKRYSLNNKIGPSLVREFRGVMAREQVSRGYIVTTTQFMAGAMREAQAMQGVAIKLIDGDKLATGAKRLGLPGVVMFK